MKVDTDWWRPLAGILLLAAAPYFFVFAIFGGFL